MRSEDKYEDLVCNNLDEANRMIQLIYKDLLIHGSGKRFWMCMFLGSVFLAPIMEPFLSGVIEGFFQ